MKIENFDEREHDLVASILQIFPGMPELVTAGVKNHRSSSVACIARLKRAENEARRIPDTMDSSFLSVGRERRWARSLRSVSEVRTSLVG